MAAHDWALLTFGKRLGTRFEAYWRDTPSQERRAWARLMLAAVVASVAALYGAIALHYVTTRGLNHLQWEERVLRAIETGPVGFGSAVWFQTFGADFMLAFVVLTSAGLAAWNRRPLLAITIVMSLLVMDAIVRVGWFSLSRDRPDIIAQGIASPGFHSFPSGHTSKTLAVYGLLASQWFRASRSVLEKLLVIALTALIALMVPYGRARMGVHWPTDIMAGWLIGGVWLGFAIAAVRHERRS